MSGLIGKKIGMTSIFDENGKNLPCTVIQAGPCVVTQVRTQDSDGYDALQLGFDDKSAKMFCQWLRLSYRKIDHSYNMLLHQVHRSSESSEFQTFENTMLAALLQSNGLSVQASLYQKSLSKVEEVDVLLARRMPTRFLALWRVVSEVRQLLIYLY